MDEVVGSTHFEGKPIIEKRRDAHAGDTKRSPWALWTFYEKGSIFILAM